MATGMALRYPSRETGYKFEATNAEGKTRRFATLEQAERWLDNGPAQRAGGMPMRRAKGGLYR